MSIQKRAETQKKLDVLERFSRAQNQDVLWENMHDSLTCYGIQDMLYAFADFPIQHLSKNRFKSFFLRTDYAPEFIKEKSGFSNDCYHQKSFLSGEPDIWSSSRDQADLSLEQLADRTLDWDFGITTGVSITTRFNGGLGGSVCGYHAPNMSWAEFEENWAEHGNIIQSLTCAFDICMREDHIDSIYPLSKRERECLLWLASGLRPQQIAYRLNTHPKTVEKQIASARIKLKSDTVAQTVAKALIFGLINP